MYSAAQSELWCHVASKTSLYLLDSDGLYQIGRLAQLVARTLCMRKVACSIHAVSIYFFSSACP